MCACDLLHERLQCVAFSSLLASFYTLQSQAENDIKKMQMHIFWRILYDL